MDGGKRFSNRLEGADQSSCLSINGELAENGGHAELPLCFCAYPLANIRQSAGRRSLGGAARRTESGVKDRFATAV